MQAMAAKHMLIFFVSFCIIACFCGSSQGRAGWPGCDVEVQIRRGTVYHASRQELVEVKCPVQHCGRAVHIIWCKVSDTNICKNLNNSEHIQINETMLLDGKLVSVLRFKRISTEDSGVYSCTVKSGLMGHFINVTVSETNQGDQKNDGNSDQPKNVERDLNSPNEDEMKTSSFTYFVIFASLVLVLLTITVLVLLRIHGKGSSQHQPKTQEEQMPSHMIPDLPKRSPPVPHKSLSRSGMVPPPPLPEKTTRDHRQTNLSAQSSEPAVYSAINRTKSRKSFQNNSPGQVTNQMNVFSVTTQF